MDKTRRWAGLLPVLLLTAMAHADEMDSPYAQTDPALTTEAATDTEAAGAPAAQPLARLQAWLDGEPDTRPLAGAATEAYLTLQASGAQGSAKPQSVSGAYRERAAARFLKTLDQEVPPVKIDSGFKSK